MTNKFTGIDSSTSQILSLVKILFVKINLE